MHKDFATEIFLVVFYKKEEIENQDNGQVNYANPTENTWKLEISLGKFTKGNITLGTIFLVVNKHLIRVSTEHTHMHQMLELHQNVRSS